MADVDPLADSTDSLPEMRPAPVEYPMAAAPPPQAPPQETEPMPVQLRSPQDDGHYYPEEDTGVQLQSPVEEPPTYQPTSNTASPSNGDGRREDDTPPYRPSTPPPYGGHVPVKDAAPLPDDGYRAGHNHSSNGGGAVDDDVEMQPVRHQQDFGRYSGMDLDRGRSQSTVAPTDAGLVNGGSRNDAHGDHMTALLSVPTWIRLHPLLGAYLAECIGTFIFVLTVALVEINNPFIPDRRDTNISSLPIGFMFMAMVLTFGYISGAHLNPAVTLAVVLYERQHVIQSIMYVVCQCGSALGAGIVAMIIKGDEGIVVPDVNNNIDELRKGFFAELIYSFALSTVVLNVAHRRAQPSLYSGMALGMVITAGIAAVGGVSGGAFNPAVATGLQLAVCFVGRCTPAVHFWMYWLAPAVGAIIGAIVFANLHQEADPQSPQHDAIPADFEAANAAAAANGAQSPTPAQEGTRPDPSEYNQQPPQQSIA